MVQTNQHNQTKGLFCFFLFEKLSESRLSLRVVYNQDTSIASNLDHWNVRLVLAIASAMKSNQRGDALYSDAVGHLCAALEVSEQVLHPGSVWSIQALLLLVIYAMMDPAHFDSWTLIGAASRMMIDLGMHQDPSKSVHMPKPKLEVRRRVFWCVYALDRYGMRPNT